MTYSHGQTHPERPSASRKRVTASVTRLEHPKEAGKRTTRTAGVVVALSLQLDGDSWSEKRSERLTSRPLHVDVDRVSRQTLLSVLPRDLVGQSRAEGSVGCQSKAKKVVLCQCTSERRVQTRRPRQLYRLARHRSRSPHKYLRKRRDAMRNALLRTSVSIWTGSPCSRAGVLSSTNLLSSRM